MTAKSKVKPKGRFQLQHIRDGEVIGVYDLQNDVVNEGKDKLLDVMFHAVTPIDPWYIGLVDNAGYSAVSATDTLASHAGWVENTDYSVPAARGEWTEGAASSQQITNAVSVDFTMNAAVTIRGIFICSAASGTSGTLWATALFTSGVALNISDVLKVTYTIST